MIVARVADLPTITLTLPAAIFGTVRNVFERSLSLETGRAVRDQLILMCITYLAAAENA